MKRNIKGLLKGVGTFFNAIFRFDLLFRDVGSWFTLRRLLKIICFLGALAVDIFLLAYAFFMIVLTASGIAGLLETANPFILLLEGWAWGVAFFLCRQYLSLFRDMRRYCSYFE